MRVHYNEKRKDLFVSDDGRFHVEKTQNKSGPKFHIRDVQKNVVVGAPKSFTAVASLTRRYLLLEKQQEENPTTAPKPKIGDGVVGKVTVSPPQTQPPPLPENKQTPPLKLVKGSSNSQIVLAHLATLAAEDGTFSTYTSTIAKGLGLAWTHVDYWLNKFIAVEWLVELEPESEGRPGCYGFNITADEVQNLVKNMPTRLFTKVVRPGVKKAEEPKPAQLPPPSPQELSPSGAGIMAGKAMVKAGQVESKLDAFIEEMRREIAAVKQMVQEREKPDTSEFQTVLEYLESSQEQVNKFMSDTFGVKIL